MSLARDPRGRTRAARTRRGTYAATVPAHEEVPRCVHATICPSLASLGPRCQRPTRTRDPRCPADQGSRVQMPTLSLPRRSPCRRCCRRRPDPMPTQPRPVRRTPPPERRSVRPPPSASASPSARHRWCDSDVVEGGLFPMATPRGPGPVQPITTADGQVLPAPNPETVVSPHQADAAGEALTETSPSSERDDPTTPPIPGVGGAAGADPFMAPEE
jgi:hypothetical protein